MNKKYKVTGIYLDSNNDEIRFSMNIDLYIEKPNDKEWVFHTIEKEVSYWYNKIINFDYIEIIK